MRIGPERVFAKTLDLTVRTKQELRELNVSQWNREEVGQSKGPKAWKCRLNVEQESIPTGSPKADGKTEQYLKPGSAESLKKAFECQLKLYRHYLSHFIGVTNQKVEHLKPEWYIKERKQELGGHHKYLREKAGILQSMEADIFSVILVQTPG